jgi:hypothetical protein
MLATDTHSEYVILITFPQQQWLHERPSILRYTCIGCRHCDSVASVRWELVLNIMQMMFSLQMIKYT